MGTTNGTIRAKQHVLLARRELVRLESDAAQEQLPPLLETELRAPRDEGSKRVPRGHLDRTDGVHAERLATLLRRERRKVLERDLGVEAAREHSLVLVDEVD